MTHHPFAVAPLLIFLFACPAAKERGDAATVIGPSGGAVVSDDGQVTLEIPAGALTESQNVRIELREDLAPEGRFYEFTPDGLVFAKPAVLRIAEAPSEEPRGIAKRLEDGSVQVRPSVSEEAHVMAEMTGFSTWGVVPCMYGEINRCLHEYAPELSYEPSRTIIVSWATPANRFETELEIQRAIVVGSLQAPADGAYTTIAYRTIVPNTFTDAAIGADAGIYWYRLRARSGRTTGAFGAARYVAVFGAAPAPTVTLPASARWTSVGAPISAPGDADYAMVALSTDASGAPVVATVARGQADPSRGELDVYRYDGGAFVALGAALNVDPSAQIGSPSIARGPDGALFVAWHEGAVGSSSVYVKRWSGTAWELLGGGAVHSPAAGPQIAILPNGTVMVVFNQSSALSGRQFSGSSWVPFAFEGSPSTGPVQYMKLGIADDGVPWVTWSEGNMGATVRVATVPTAASPAWLVRGPDPLVTVAAGDYLSGLALDPSGTVRVLAGNGYLATTLVNRRWDTGAFTEDAGLVATTPLSPLETTHAFGLTLVAFLRDYRTVEVRAFNGSSFELVGPTHTNAAPVNDVDITFDGVGTVYIADARDDGSPGKNIHVRKLEQ